MKKNILVIIPARNGSKGIKDKNIISVAGQPLISYTIKPALRLKKEKIVDDVIVSTDSEIIAAISIKLGATVPFLRPKDISGDCARAVDFALHALNFYAENKIFYKNIMILQPTSPLRLYSDLQNAINLYKKRRDSISLISAYKEQGLIKSILYVKKGEKAVPLFSSLNQESRRQDMQKIYVRNGAIYIVASNYIKRSKRIMSNNPIMLEMPKSRSINIDYPEDLVKLNKLLCK
jgi:CMP-N,N'-diacetyllegionaminic acid synthase